MNGPIASTETPLFVGGNLSENDFSGIREVLLRERSVDLGMYKDQCIRRRIATRVRACGCRTGGDYLNILSTDAAEVEALMAALAIHVSQFFRNPEVFARLEAKVLPDLVKSLGSLGRSKIRVWSAGCASGEEIYSIALLLQELDLKGLELDLLGSDISTEVLPQARAACFDSLRLTQVPARVLRHYFHPLGRKWQLAEEVRSQVHFLQHNLLNDPLPEAADLILCRNVLIYFSRADQNRILTRFAELLPEHGVLVIGNTESLIGPVRDLFEPLFPAERIYRRKVKA